MTRTPWIAFAALCLACSSGSSSPGEGNERGPCFPNGTCNDGLVCASDVCVRVGGTGGSGGAAGSAGGTQADCFENCVAMTGDPDTCRQVCPGGTGGAGAGGAGAAGAGGTVPGAPMILSFNTNVDMISPTSASVTFTVIATDPDGIEDLIGGSLLDPDSGSSYGPLATGAQEGAYGATLTWGDIHRVRSIDAPAGGIGRTFRAELFDVAGNRATADVGVSLSCGAQLAVCAGVCSTTCEPCPAGFDCVESPAVQDLNFCVEAASGLAPTCGGDPDCQAAGLSGACVTGQCLQDCFLP